VHDCFSITELVTMEDLFLSNEGGAVRDVLNGAYDSSGTLPCQIDGGLKCFGHPVGARGVRMLYEIYLQLQAARSPGKLGDPSLGLIHNLGGQPSQNVCAVSIVGREGA
jgi:acetyl-CoA C-acetyltransferase